MSELDAASQPAAPAAEETEAQMRRALGLDGRSQAPRNHDRTGSASPTQDRFQAHRPPRRFVQDGEVPVVVLRRDHQADGTDGIAGPSTNQLESARNAIRTQSAARERAERALADAQILIRDLQTKLAHERMAKDEAIRRVDAEREASQLVLQAVQAELTSQRQTRDNLAGELRAAQDAQRKAEEAPAQVSEPPQLDKPPRLSKPRGRPAKRALATDDDQTPAASAGQPELELEAEPVQWWVKGWQKQVTGKRR